MPDEPDTVVQPPAAPSETSEPREPDEPQEPVEAEEPDSRATAPPPPAVERERARGPIIVGLAFVALGAFFLVDEIWPDFLAWKYVWPVALIAVGVAVLARARR